MSSKAQNIQFLLSQVRASGVALSGGQVFFYSAGTDELKAVWLDRGKVTQAANPYTLDANATAQLYGDGLYRIVIKTSAGVTVYDRDNLSFLDVGAELDALTDISIPDISSYGSTFAEAVAAIGSTPLTVGFRSDQTVSANITIPSTLELVPLNGAKINHGAYTVTYAGSTARWSMAQIFSGTGAVTFTGNISYAVPQWFGAKGDDSTLDSAAFRSAVASCNRVYVPPGIYRVGMIKLPSDSEFFGAGDSTVLRRAEGIDSGGTGIAPTIEYIVLLATNYGDEGTADIADNKKNIYVHDLQLDGRSRDFTPNAAFYHNMAISATSNMTVERVTFYDFLGDGAYLGPAGSGSSERHNTNIKFLNCIFDGANNGNRNGLSVIDCDGLVVENSTFKRIGNATLSQSVGGIDFEPNQDWAIVRYSRMVNCTFEDISTTNTAAISVFNTNQTGLNMHGWLIEGCTFTRCYAGFGGSAVRKTSISPNDNITIRNSTFINTTTFDIINLGFKGFAIEGNTFQIDPIASSSYRGAIKLGQLSDTVNSSAFDTIISNNKFIGLRPQFGMMAVFGVHGLIVSNNTFEDITGIIIKFLSPAEAGTSRYLSGIRIVGNTANNALRAAGTVTTSSFIGSTGGINADNDNSFINTTNVEYQNVMNHGVPKFGGGVLAIFREHKVSAAPTSGTWTVADKLYLSGPSAGSVGTVCSVSGTFGTLADATGDATNASAVLLNVADPNDSLREGQWITIAGDAAKKQIVEIDGTTVYLSGTYTGVTGTGLALAWSAPTFVTF